MEVLVIGLKIRFETIINGGVCGFDLTTVIDCVDWQQLSD